MAEPMTYSFVSEADDQEVAMIEVALRALSTLDREGQARVVRYLADRVESEQGAER